jgi:hypothetical protein
MFTHPIGPFILPNVWNHLNGHHLAEFTGPAAVLLDRRDSDRSLPVVRDIARSPSPCERERAPLRVVRWPGCGTHPGEGRAVMTSEPYRVRCDCQTPDGRHRSDRVIVGDHLDHPVYVDRFCPECGGMGWLTVQDFADSADAPESRLHDDPFGVYSVHTGAIG